MSLRMGRVWLLVSQHERIPRLMFRGLTPPSNYLCGRPHDELVVTTSSVRGVINDRFVHAQAIRRCRASISRRSRRRRRRPQLSNHSVTHTAACAYACFWISSSSSSSRIRIRFSFWINRQGPKRRRVQGAGFTVC